MSGEILRDKKGREYELVPPEGGWGFIITLSISLFFSVTVVPLAVFGMIFGEFLASIGDETYGITLANGIFNTILSFTGLFANYLLQKFSCRKVGLLGALFYFIGSLTTAFVNNLWQLICTFGVLQGIGFGLLMPAVFTSFNGYFDKRKNVMMGLAQALIVAITMLAPIITEKLLQIYDWRVTQLIYAALSLNCFLAMTALQPVKWHMKKRYINKLELHNVNSAELGNSNSKKIDSEQPLLKARHHAMQGHIHNLLERRRPSIISVGSMAVSITNLDRIGDANQSTSLWQRMYDGLDLGLFKSPMYCNIALGLSLGLTADLLFLSLLPMILKNTNYTAAETTLVLTIYFGSDLVSRFVLTFLSAVVKLKNRYVFLCGALFSAIFRTALTMNTSLTWVCTVCAALGFLRCFIQTPLPLVVAEQYGERFSTAFTLYMVVCGMVFLVFSPLIGYVKKVTQSDTMVLHLLTLAYLGCAVPWIIEITCKKCSKKKDERT